MQKTALLVMVVCTSVVSTAQKTEFRASLNSGLFSFAGPSAEAVSVINYSDQSQSGYTNNPYGSKAGLCLGLSGNVKRVSRKNFLWGANLGIEVLRCKTGINGISGYTGYSTYELDASGRTYLNFTFLNLHPFLGYRLLVGKTAIDITGGLEFAYCLSAKEKGKATASNGQQYETALNRNKIAFDVRPSVQIATDINNWGVYAGYSFGTTNYRAGYVGGVNECYARLLRFGVTYKL